MSAGPPEQPCWRSAIFCESELQYSLGVGPQPTRTAETTTTTRTARNAEGMLPLAKGERPLMRGRTATPSTFSLSHVEFVAHPPSRHMLGGSVGHDATLPLTKTPRSL